MSMGLVFWIIMLIWLIFWVGIWAYPGWPYWGHIHPLIFWILLALLGWKVFGPMIHS